MTEGLPGEGRHAALFVRHLDGLRDHLRSYRKIHVLRDNARSHECRRVCAYLRDWGHRVPLHFRPAYAPEANPIERIGWHLHEEITRNHRCGGMDELLDLVFAWLDHRSPFAIEDQTYPLKPAA